MASVLFTHGQTLYAKVTIPVALYLLARGHDITFRANRPVVFGHSFGFSEDIIKRRPTTVGVVNPAALDYVADLIGLGDAWRAAAGRIRFRYGRFGLDGSQDIIVGTTKDLGRLRAAAIGGAKTIALGYQHFPVVASTLR